MVRYRKPVRRSDNIVDRRPIANPSITKIKVKLGPLEGAKRTEYEVMMRREAEAQLRRVQAARSRRRPR